MDRVPLVISGGAVITPLDDPATGSDTWGALAAGERVGSGGGRCAVAEEFLEGDARWDRSIRLAIGAARRALRQAGGSEIAGDTALFCGTSKGPAGVMLRVIEKLRRGEMPAEAEAQQVMLGVGAMGILVGEALGIARVHTSVAACASGMVALHRAAEAVGRGECERAVVVAADASLHPLFEGSFGRLGVLAPADDQGVRRCEPFGRGAGFFVSEAAAAVVLENAKRKTQSAKQDMAVGLPLAWLEATWIGGDGTGMVAADRSGEALRRGLAHCAGGAGGDSPVRGIADSPAFVHAHATGTAHDGDELAAIRAVFGERPAVFSSKGQLGHSLGAAGLVSVVISAMCHAQGRTLCGGSIMPQSSSLTIAQGFGGHIGVVRLRGV